MFGSLIDSRSHGCDYSALRLGKPQVLGAKSPNPHVSDVTTALFISFSD
jgi:hypothetical protein